MTAVMLYIPNLIGYARIAAMLVSFYLAFGCTSPTDCDVNRADYKTAVLFYMMNFAGDLVDGYAARALDQCSKYGGVLDMVTDRTSTAGLCALLATLYPREALVFTALMVLDIFSHWFHVVGAEMAHTHHKQHQTSFFLKWYYGCYPLFAYCCVSQELYYLSRWILRYATPAPVLVGGVDLAMLATFVFLPGCCMKQVVNVAQFWNAAGNIADLDQATRKHKK
mmetsp:Transcript_21048/g.47478  ORF Transcript_21048/g.47478 Transcript_21048/m.47478 type:complete len:223 (+) Transcript_21048:219-887(+)